MSYGPEYPSEPSYGTPPSLGQPLPLGDALKQLPAQYWRAVSKPGAATFAQEKDKAAWNIVWVQIIALAVFSAIVSLLVFNFYLPTVMAMFMTPSLSGSSVPPLMAQQAEQRIIASIQATSIPVSLSYIIFVPLGLFVGLGILHLIAKAFGGQGKFVQYIYGYLLFGVPISVVSSVLAFIPILGGLVAFALGIYHIVLQVLMTMGVQRLSGGKATLVVLLPLIVVVVLVIVVSIIIGIAVTNAMMPHY